MSIPSRPWNIPPWAPSAFVFLISFSLFSPSLAFDFVYDARYQILSGDFLHNPASWPSVLTLRVLSMDVLDFNRPVHLASLMLDAAIWGREPFGYHLTNVLLHAINAVIVYFVALRILQASSPLRPRVWPAFAGALLFALHPLQAEAVCEPSYREDLLVVFFSLAALLCATGITADSEKSQRILRGVACAALCLLASASKETGLAAAGFLLLWRLCFVEDGTRKWWTGTLAASIAATALFATLRFTLEITPSTIFETKPRFLNGTLPAALATQPLILALYARNFFLPSALCADYGPASLGSLNPLEAWAGFSAILVIAALVASRSRPAAFSLGFIALALLPVSNLLPMFNPAADRYLYLPLAGAGFLLAIGLAALPQKGTTPLATTTVTLLLLGALGLAAWNRQFIWRDSQSLWEDTAQKNPTSRNAWLGLGFDLQRRGRASESTPHFERALEVSGPGDAEAWTGLAVALDAHGDSPAARAAMDKALEANPEFRNPEQRAARAIMEIHHARAVRLLLEKHPQKAAE